VNRRLSLALAFFSASSLAEQSALHSGTPMTVAEKKPSAALSTNTRYGDIALSSGSSNDKIVHLLVVCLLHRQSIVSQPAEAPTCQSLKVNVGP
jgi:hypothetical protein